MALVPSSLTDISRAVTWGEQKMQKEPDDSYLAIAAMGGTISVLQFVYITHSCRLIALQICQRQRILFSALFLIADTGIDLRNYQERGCAI